MLKNRSTYAEELGIFRRIKVNSNNRGKVFLFSFQKSLVETLYFELANKFLNFLVSSAIATFLLINIIFSEPGAHFH